MKKIIIGLTALAATLVLGVVIGQVLSLQSQRQQFAQVKASAPRPTFKLDDPFPSVDLSIGDEAFVLTDELLTEGAVVLFMDLDCAPCTELARQWDEAVTGGEVAAGRVFGITAYPEEAITAYRNDNDIKLPIYHDYDNVFMHDYDVRVFPTEVIVSADGNVVSIRNESNRYRGESVFGDD